jgi:beta-lactam-binding protein with PASTA domain
VLEYPGRRVPPRSCSTNGRRVSACPRRPPSGCPGGRRPSPTPTGAASSTATSSPPTSLFDEDGRLRVADFGLARALAEASLTEPAGATVGTARYAAPEQALGRPVDGRADVYSLGLVLYEAVTGVVPFTADTTAGTLMARVGARIPGHDGLGPLAEVLDAASAPEVDQRLEASDLVRRLSELGRDLAPPEPLPLAGAGGLGVAQVGARQAIDRTEHGMGPYATIDADGGGETGRSDISNRSDTTDAMAMATAVGVATAEEPEKEAKVKRERRRWPWIASIVVLVLALAAAGGAYAAARTKLFIPSHRLPAVTGVTPAQATAALRADKLHVRVLRRHSSTTVPSGQIIRQIPAAGTVLKEQSTVSVIVSTGPPPVPVPSLAAVTGDCPAVTAALKTAHLLAACTHANSTTIASGTVVSWTPTGHATEFSTVHVVVSSGPPTETIPSLTGSTCTGATTALEAVHLVAQCTPAYSPTVPTGEVISWTPTGTALEGATVAISVSEGPQPVIVPPLDGDTVSEASAALTTLGLVPTTDGPIVGHVFDSTPEAGTSVAPGATVTLYIR